MMSLSSITIAQDLILNKGDISPHEGILVAEPRYRLYTSDKLKFETLDSKINDLLVAKPIELSVKLDSFFSGFSLGVIMAYTIIILGGSSWTGH